MTKKTFSGAVPATALSGSLSSSATSFTVNSATGYPSGSTGPFVVCIDRGTSSEEKILISSVASTTFTVAASGRGYDGTLAVTHAVGAAVEHVLDAATISEANDHVNTTTRDDHTQYLTNARHDLTTRHAFGAALGTPGTPAAVGTTASAGSGTVPARSDHVHVLGTDSVITASIAANAVTTAKLAAGAVTASQIASGTITATQIASGTITDTQLASGAVTSAKLAASAVTSAAIADGTVDTAELADGAVTEAKLHAASVSRGKLVANFTAVTHDVNGPASPTGGELWYDTTAKALKHYTTATTGWVAPWNMAWGAQAVATTTTVQSSIGGTATDLTSLTGSLSSSWPANRRVKVRVFLPGCVGTTANDSFELRIQEGATVLQAARISVNSAFQYVPATAEIVVTPTAGAHTYKAVMVRTAGTGTIDNGAASASTSTAIFTVEDLGPSGAPA